MTDQIEKEVYEGLIIATILASVKKVSAGLRHAASGQHQDYEPGTLELGVALDGLKMLGSDVIACVLSNASETFMETEELLNSAAAGFATIANNTNDDTIKAFAEENFQAIKRVV